MKRWGMVAVVLALITPVFAAPAKLPITSLKEAVAQQEAVWTRLCPTATIEVIRIRPVAGSYYYYVFYLNESHTLFAAAQFAVDGDSTPFTIFEGRVLKDGTLKVLVTYAFNLETTKGPCPILYPPKL